MKGLSKRSRFTEQQIAYALEQQNSARQSMDRRKMGIAQATFSSGRSDGLGPPELRRLRQLEEENAKLKKLVADLSLDKAMLQDVVRRKL
jgi:putative transposase